MKIFLSSSKPSHSLSALLHPSPTHFWHTNGHLPHYIHLQFNLKTYINKITLFLSYKKDDSYTPEELTIFVDTYKKNTIKVFEPEGDVDLGVDCYGFDFVVVVRGNHQEGRDSHVRGLKVYGRDGVEIVAEK